MDKKIHQLRDELKELKEALLGSVLGNVLFLFVLFLSCLSLSACVSSSHQPAPVVNLSHPKKRIKNLANVKTTSAKSVKAKSLQTKGVYVVQNGETLFSIARKQGQDPQNLAILNDIHPPYKILKGQKIVLSRPPSQHSNAQSSKSRHLASNTVNQKQVYKQKTMIQSHYFSGEVSVDESEHHSKNTVKKEYDKQSKAGKNAQNHRVIASNSKTQGPKLDKDKGENVPITGTIQWRWPARGRIVRPFQGTGKGKGIDIAGTLGKPIKAAASGVVVYSGNGLKGYGNLIIIKHNEDFLSAYAHNRELMVKEGERVGLGQEIARMGQTDAEQVKVHFEIRYKGKPVNPMHFLPKA